MNDYKNTFALMCHLIVNKWWLLESGSILMFSQQVTSNKIENEWHWDWNISVITVEGDNIFEPVHATAENIVFTSKNVDRAGQTTNLIFVVGKNGSGFSDVVREVSPWK